MYLPLTLSPTPTCPACSLQTCNVANVQGTGGAACPAVSVQGRLRLREWHSDKHHFCTVMQFKEQVESVCKGLSMFSEGCWKKYHRSTASRIGRLPSKVPPVTLANLLWQNSLIGAGSHSMVNYQTQMTCPATASCHRPDRFGLQYVCSVLPEVSRTTCAPA